jgi:hypothetical protein
METSPATSRVDLVWVALAAGSGVCALGLFYGYLPIARPGLITHLADLDAAIPFSVRFVLTPSAPAGVLALALALLLAGVVLRWGLRRPRSARLSWGLAFVLAAGTVGLGASGLASASRLTAYPLGPGLERCTCPKLEALARECHCEPSGALREVYFRTEDLAGTLVGDRLLYAAKEPSRSPWIRRALSPEGETFALEDGAELRCRYASPCAPDEDCGPCRFDPPPPRAEFELRPEVHCIDVRTGTRALGQSFVHLRRRVWRDTTDGQALPARLDPAHALTTAQSELIGRVDGAAPSVIRDIVSGAARAPALRIGGVRECRASANDLGMAAEGLDVELEPMERLIVQIEAVDEDEAPTTPSE